MERTVDCVKKGNALEVTVEGLEHDERESSLLKRFAQANEEKKKGNGVFD